MGEHTSFCKNIVVSLIVIYCIELMTYASQMKTCVQTKTLMLILQNICNHQHLERAQIPFNWSEITNYALSMQWNTTQQLKKNRNYHCNQQSAESQIHSANWKRTPKATYCRILFIGHCGKGKTIGIEIRSVDTSSWKWDGTDYKVVQN